MRKTVFLALIFLGLFLSSASVFAAAEISTNLPGPYDVAETGPVGIIANAYYIALGIGGLLAFGSIVYAGIRWTTSQGNPGTISDAKDQIVQALWGLVLLGGAYVILNTINPELTVLRLPALGEIVAPAGTTSSSTPPAAEGECSSGECVSISSVVATCKNGCSADQKMLDALTCLHNEHGWNLRITEAMPPSSAHKDPRHNNGCAVDITLHAPPVLASDCAKVRDLMSDISSCGGSGLNEYFATCGGSNTEHSTGEHIHMKACN